MPRIFISIIIITFLSAHFLKSQELDTTETINYNKSTNILLGFGSIEVVNLGFGLRLIDGVYIDIYTGVASSLTTFEGFPELGTFWKLGGSWRILKRRVTPVISIHGGEISYGYSTGSVFSILAGMEHRLNGGGFLSFKAGERYFQSTNLDHRKNFGVQVGFGWNL